MRADGAEFQGIFPGQHADALGAHGDGLVGQGDLRDPVQRRLQLVAGFQHSPSQVIGYVAARAADGAHGIVDTVAGQLFEQIHDQLALIPDVHEHAVMTDDMAGNAQPQEVGVQTLQFRRDHTDVLTALRRLDAVEFLHAHRIGKRMGVGADSAHTLHQNQRLDRVALRGQFLDAAVIVADKDLCVLWHESAPPAQDGTGR